MFHLTRPGSQEIEIDDLVHGVDELLQLITCRKPEYLGALVALCDTAVFVIIITITITITMMITVMIMIIMMIIMMMMMLKLIIFKAPKS